MGQAADRLKGLGRNRCVEFIKSISHFLLIIHVDGEEVTGESILWPENCVSKYVTNCICFVGTEINLES